MSCIMVTRGGVMMGAPSPPLPYPVSNVSTDTALTAVDQIVIVDTTSNTVDITLPLASAMTGKFIYIKRISAGGNALTVLVSDASTIDGLASQAMAFQWDAMLLSSNGTQWSIL